MDRPDPMKIIQRILVDDQSIEIFEALREWSADNLVGRPGEAVMLAATRWYGSMLAQMVKEDGQDVWLGFLSQVITNVRQADARTELVEFLESKAIERQEREAIERDEILDELAADVDREERESIERDEILDELAADVDREERESIELEEEFTSAELENGGAP